MTTNRERVVTTDKRHLVALNADIVGFSRLMADDPAGTTDAVEELRSVVEARVAASNGTLVNFVGDSFMAVFEDSLDAIHTAIGLTVHLDDLNAEVPKHRRLQLRIGLDEGEVEHREGDYFGDALNIAARIQAKAPAGGISLSGRVYRSLDEPDLRFRSTGSHQLRNIPEPTEIYEYRGLPSGGSGAIGASRLSLERPTLLILPFVREHTSPDVDAMTSAFISELTHRLAPIPQLRVVESADASAPTEGAAHYLLQPGALQVGDRVRLYAKLMHVGTLNVVSSHKWSTTVDSLFDEIDSMVEEVARKTEVELVVGEPAMFYETLGDPAALRDLYQSWYLLSLESADDWAHAVELLAGVVRNHPEYLYGRILLAFANWMGAASGYVPDPEPLYEKAFQQAAEVIEMEDPTGMGHVIQGAIHIDRGMPDEALASIETAMVTRPTCDLTHALEGSIRRYLGDWRRSVELLDRAIKLSAVTPPWYATVQASALFQGRHLDLAGETAEEVVEHQPDSLEALLILAAVQAEMGLDRRARATAERARAQFPTVDFDRWLEHHPYTDRALVERWRESLTTAGLFESG